MSSRKQGGRPGKYGEDDDDDQRDGMPRPDPNSGKRTRQLEGLPNNDAPELMTDDNMPLSNNTTKKQSVKGADARTEQAAKAPRGTEYAVSLSPEEVLDLTTDDSNRTPDRKETTEEADARIKEAARAQTRTTAVESGSEDIPSMWPETHQTSNREVASGEASLAGLSQDEDLEASAQKDKKPAAVRATQPGAVAMTGADTNESAKKTPADETEDQLDEDGRRTWVAPVAPTGVAGVTTLDDEPDLESQAQSVQHSNASSVAPPVSSLIDDYSDELPAPGAFRVAGVSGGGIDDSDDDSDNAMSVPTTDSHHHVHEQTASTQSTGSHLPQAMPVAAEEEEDDGVMQEEFLENLARAEPASSGDEVTKPRGVISWIGQHPYITAGVVLLVIAGVVGGVVGATLSSSSDGPTSAPPPTIAPTTVLEGEVIEVLSKLTPLSILQKEGTPQNAALNWLMSEDIVDVNMNNESKLLQRYALAVIYYATNGPNWFVQAGFLSDVDECDWNEVRESDGLKVGVEFCDENGLAVNIFFAQNNLAGTIPEEIAALTSVTYIQMAVNALTGTLPEGITRLTALQDLRLFDNLLSGSLPDDFGDLNQMTYLPLQNNSFTGEIPPSLGKMTLLDEALVLGQNKFFGPLPSTLGNLVNLRVFLAADNLLSGVIPAELSNMASLRVLYLEGNDLTGGLEVFCTDNIPNLQTFQSDCLASDSLFGTAVEAEVECSCCSSCCNSDISGCVPN